MHEFGLAILGLACLATTVHAQTMPVTAPASLPRPGCTGTEHRQLDFWIGHWRVVNTSDLVEYASSTIERVLGGCAISESYAAPGAPGGAYQGSSYSAFDRKDGRWHQFYVDSNGAVTWYSGTLVDAAIVLEASGARAAQRMTYRMQQDGSVRQIGETSVDGGKSWQPGYDYTYLRRADPPREAERDR